MKVKTIYIALAILWMSLLFLPVTQAQTTCQAKDCMIKITLHIAFAGATDQQIEDWKNDIEDVWNDDDQTTGDCECPVSIKVETMKITDPAQVNCNPGPPGYHCIMVTPFATNPPTDTAGKTYIAYMYPPGVALKGQTLSGWWSDQMNRPAPEGGIYHDAAHEAGHMLGLYDYEDTGLMTYTSGDNAKPTQFNIDMAVEEICGDACPDRCCCGNGLIEGDKGESCDPMATPSGCGNSDACCAVCCNCFTPVCNPKKGQYATQSECETSCTGNDKKCFLNYKTGCWDCVKSKIVEHKRVYNESLIKKCKHVVVSLYDILKQLEGYDLSTIPMLCGLPPIESMNLHIEGEELFSMSIFDCSIETINNFPMPSATMNAFTDKETITAITNDEITMEQAVADGRIILEPVL